MKAYLTKIAYYLPKGILNNEILNEQFPEWSVDKISSKTGINERHIASEGELSSDMAEKIANQLFETHQIDKSSIDFLLFCTQSPDYFLPTTACLLQDRLGLSVNCGALDFNLGCSGYVYGLSLAKGLICSGAAKNVLLITSETYSKFIHPEDKSNRTIFGDAASASIISSEATEGFEIQDFVFGTDGSGGEHLMVKYGGLRHPIKSQADATAPEAFLYMNGQEVFSFTIQRIPKLIADVAAKNNVEKEEIDLFVFHQANKFMMEHLQKKASIPNDKFFIHLEGCGNTVSSTIPIALLEAVKAKKINNKSKIMLAGFGVGLSWAGTVLTYKS